MNAKEFYTTVVLMRRAQKQYFATRSKEALAESKMYEQQIDKEIERVTAILDKMKKQ